MRDISEKADFVSQKGMTFLDRVLHLDEIQTTVTNLGTRYGIERAYLFGSYARGDATPESDIDLRIDQGKLRGYFALSGLCLALQEQLGTKVDLLTSDSLDEKFLNRIHGEEILLYAGSGT